MKANQVEKLNTEVTALLTKYGAEKNYFLAYVFIDEEEGSISSPCIANVTGLKGHGVSMARAAGFLCEVISDTLISILCRYNGLDIMSASGALKGMIDEARGTQMMQKQMDQARQGELPFA